MHLSLSIWLLAILAAFMIGMSKTGVSGLGTLVVPLMAFIFGGMPSSGLVLPMLIVADIFGVVYYHRSANWSIILKILPWAVLGIVIGLFVGKGISTTHFKQLIGVLVLISLGVMLWLEFNKRLIENAVSNKPWFAAPFGVMGGFSTMIGNAAGPIMGVYLLTKNIPKKEYIGTAAWFFCIVNIVKLPMQIWGWHNITLETLTFNAVLIPAIALGAFTGIQIVKLIPEKGYRWFVIVVTVLSAIALF